MAFVISLTAIDAYGRTTSKRFENNRATIADAVTDAGTLVTAWQAVSDLGITKYEIAQATAQSVSAQAGSNLDTGGTVHVSLDNSKLYAIKIPGIKASLINTDGSIDLADEDLIAYVAQFLTGGHLRMSEGNYVTGMRYGELDK